MWRVKLLGTLNGMKCRSERQSSVRQKARVLHEPSHKVDLCVAGIARSQLLLETSQRNFEVMQSIMKFSWCIYSGITSAEMCFQLLLHSMKLFNWIKEFKFSPEEMICIVINWNAKFINKSYVRSKRGISPIHRYSW